MGKTTYKKTKIKRRKLYIVNKKGWVYIMNLFSTISKKLNMSEEERAIEKEAKSLLSEFNSLINRYETWYSNCNNKNRTYQSMLSFREIDERMLKESKLDVSIDNLEKSYNTLNN